MTWHEIGRSHLSAAKTMVAAHPRSAVSRAYYAAHVVLSDSLAAAGCPLPPDRQTVSHEAQPRSIGVHLLAVLGPGGVRDVRRIVRRLYRRRIDADYRRTVGVTAVDARDAFRDAAVLFAALGVKE